MFGRTSRKHGGSAAADPLLTAPLPDRVKAAHSRLEHQHDPALVEALSEEELAAKRAVAERIREHERREELARVEAAEATAGHVRRATDAIVRADAQDLILARRALAEQRREASPHAQLASLYRYKKWSSRALAGVVIGAMVWSAVNVQHNIAPGGPSEPLYWASYLLEALISIVLVVFMVSNSAVARWKVTDGDGTILGIEIFLLAATITLNTYPYLRDGLWFETAVHAVAPIMIGVALFAHTAVSKRLGAAIALASLEVSDDADDITERLAELTRVATPPARDEDTVIAEFEREFTPAPRAINPNGRAARDTDPAVDRAREDVDRAPIAREDTADSIAIDDGSVAIDDASSIATEAAGRSREEQSTPVRGEESIARDAQPVDRAPIADRSPAEQATDRESIADHDDPTEEEPTEAARDADEDRALDAAVVSLVRDSVRARSIARDTVDRSRANRASIARERSTEGALARVVDRAPIARETSASGKVDRAPFAGELNRAQAIEFARAVVDRGLSKQPIDVLARIFEVRSQGHSKNRTAAIVGLPHSTVGRAIDAVSKVAGPRAID
ncbi:hypothetical protein [Nocardia farcinica]|uniref:hypothetical protein n=1 Tax=Nocardia farcinica TaxID=37329 RepID=UPI001893E9B8|nr:hypothetical protein [Nocardia farcinica]MBF6411452.1 hypothetical protein [Nocardia farcinica]